MEYESFYHGLSNTHIYAKEIEKSDVLNKNISYFFTCEDKDCDIFRSNTSFDFYYIKNNYKTN